MTAPASISGTRVEILRRKGDFERAYREGRRLVNPLFVAFVRRPNDGVLRMAVVASRKVGGAVERNRAKRLLREAYRRNLPRTVVSADIVLVARRPLPEVAFREVEAAYVRGVGRWFEKISGAPG